MGVRRALSVVLALCLTLSTGSVAAQTSGREPGDGPAALGRYRIGNSTDAVTAAIDMSLAVFDTDTAPQVVLARADVFADSLAGAVLTEGRGPLLFVPGGPDAALPISVQSELDRVLPPPSGCDGEPDVFLLGGSSAVSISIEQALRDQGRCPQRFAGESRVETAVAIATHALQRYPTTRVLLARADTWADAATGGAYAALSGDPIVVTQPESMHPAVENFLRDRSWNDIVLLGGTSALSSDVQRAAQSHGPVRRVSGDARDATATAIADQLWPHTDQVTLVNGYTETGWVHALAAASPAAAIGAPQVYVHADSIPAATQTLIDARSPIDMVIGAGPDSLIADGVITAAGGGNGKVHDGGTGGDQPAPPTGPIPTGTYVCYQGGTFFFDNVEIIDQTTYDPHGAEGGQFQLNGNVLTFLTGNFASWVSRGEYHADGGPDFPNDGPTVLLYFDDDSGEERRIVCGYGED